MELSMTTPTANPSTEQAGDAPHAAQAIAELLQGPQTYEHFDAVHGFLVQHGISDHIAHSATTAITLSHRWKDAEALIHALKQLPAQVDLRASHEGTIQAARSNYAEPSDNDIEIDEVPLLTDAGDGVWVSAWVWVRTDEDEGS